MSVRWGVAALVVSCLVALPVRAAAAQTSDGWTARMRLTVDSGGGRTQTTAMAFRFADHKVRTEIDEMPGRSLGPTMAGVYMLAADNDSTIWTVIPAQQMAMTMDPSRMMGAMAPRFEVIDARMERVDDLGAGDVMLGHATRHLRSTYSSTTKIAFGGDSCIRRVTTTSEMWIAPDVDLETSLLAMTRQRGALNGTFDALMKARGSALPKGTSLRTVSTVSAPGARDTVGRVVSTIEFTELTRGPLDAALFVVPPGFQTMDMRAMASFMPREMIESSMHESMGKLVKAMCDPGKSP